MAVLSKKQVCGRSFAWMTVSNSAVGVGVGVGVCVVYILQYRKIKARTIWTRGPRNECKKRRTAKNEMEKRFPVGSLGFFNPSGHAAALGSTLPQT